jgi:Flp pilus assembly protein TadD
VFVVSRRYREALDHLEAAATLLPDEPNVEYLRGQALEGLGRREEARRAYQRVSQLAPDSELARRAQARLAHL